MDSKKCCNTVNEWKDPFVCVCVCVLVWLCVCEREREFVPKFDRPPGLNFIVIFCTAFTLSDPKSVKRYWWLKSIFYAFGIYKHKMLVKLTPGVNFINILFPRFLYKILAPKITKPNVTREKLPKRLAYEKCACKMLMKLTAGFALVTFELS
jgi:hypothetical protein